MEDRAIAQRVAIVVVHGVAAHPRYEFQDQVSGLLRERLNATQPANDEWVVDVLNPPGSIPAGADEPRPTISRVHRKRDPASAPKESLFDIIEAYWSPISKGKTNWFLILRWLLRSTFTPLNTTARYNASWQKQSFDYLFIGGALVLAFVLFGVSLAEVWQSLSTILHVTGLIRATTSEGVIDTLNANVSTTVGLPIKIVGWVFVGVIGAYLVTQGAKATVSTVQQFHILRNDWRALMGRIVAVAVPSVLGALLIFQMASARFPGGVLGWQGVGFLVLIFVAFELGRAILQDFLVGFFGDVQIYCTHDENSNLFDLRERIIDVTVDAARRAISPDRNGGYTYDRVIIFAHSLGATIAMDAILRLYQLAEQGGVSAEDFSRIRAFITLGASLEKTKYFFDVATPSRSLSFGQWRSDVYGALFTSDRDAVQAPDGSAGIFWANYWYFTDPICNRIESYRSYLRPGDALSEGSALRIERRLESNGDEAGRVICRNEQGVHSASLLHPIIHSDYLYDDWFWGSALPIITCGLDEA
jgi:hypothetical protein